MHDTAKGVEKNAMVLPCPTRPLSRFPFPTQQNQSGAISKSMPSVEDQKSQKNSNEIDMSCLYLFVVVVSVINSPLHCNNSGRRRSIIQPKHLPQLPKLLLLPLLPNNPHPIDIRNINTR